MPQIQLLRAGNFTNVRYIYICVIYIFVKNDLNVLYGRAKINTFAKFMIFMQGIAPVTCTYCTSHMYILHQSHVHIAPVTCTYCTSHMYILHQSHVHIAPVTLYILHQSHVHISKISKGETADHPRPRIFSQFGTPGPLAVVIWYGLKKIFGDKISHLYRGGGLDAPKPLRPIIVRQDKLMSVSAISRIGIYIRIFTFDLVNSKIQDKDCTISTANISEMMTDTASITFAAKQKAIYGHSIDIFTLDVDSF